VTGEPPSPGRAILLYNLGRLALLAACLGLGWLAGLQGIWLIVAALLVSGVLSWFVLARQRVRMGLAVEQTVGRRRRHWAERTAAEDRYVDDLMAGHRAETDPAAGEVEPRPGS
jgi:hypothetical protein